MSEPAECRFPLFGIMLYAAAMSEQPLSRHERDEARRREALDALKSLGESDTFADSALARASRRTADHFAGRDASEPDGANDPVELWGRRIGRALSLLGAIGLGIYLYLTYWR